MEVNSINMIREGKVVQIQLVQRKGNTLADYFANLAFNFAGTFIQTVSKEFHLPERGSLI